MTRIERGDHPTQDNDFTPFHAEPRRFGIDRGEPAARDRYQVSPRHY